MKIILSCNVRNYERELLTLLPPFKTLQISHFIFMIAIISLYFVQFCIHIKLSYVTFVLILDFFASTTEAESGMQNMKITRESL